MKFQVGDRVIVLHSEEEGEVVDIINNKMVMVDVRGVKFPAYIDQLDFPYFKRFSQNKPQASQKKPKRFIDEVPREKKHVASKEETGVWLTFIPVTDTDEFGDEIVEALKIHLINRTNAPLHFEYLLDYIGKDGFELKNNIAPFEDFYIHDMPFENMNDSPSFNFIFSLQKPDKKKAESFETSLKLKPKQVFNRIQEIKQKGDATFSYKLLDTYPDKPIEDKMEMAPLLRKGYKVYPASSARQHLEPAKYELDLHIEKLNSDYASLSSFEKLTLQLQTLEKYLDLAVAHHQPSMIVIHGVGTGKLRDEIHEVLRVRRDVKSFINRYHPAYGYGATEVYFK
ncbi:MAG: Smr/MutS family protein [Chitinophagaceae bacterium]|nr:Smr/MutS family protein [Chitinophagaceae bacterium]